MAKRMVYYLSWEEDDWLDEILDYFRDVNALVPTGRSLGHIREQREQGDVDQGAIIVNASGEPEEIRALIDLILADELLARDPLLLVGMKEAEADEWRSRYPEARVAAVPPFAFDFDYAAVLAALEAEWGEGREGSARV